MPTWLSRWLPSFLRRPDAFVPGDPPLSADLVPAELLTPIDLWGEGSNPTGRTGTTGELPPQIQGEVDRLAKAGNARMDAGEYVEALRLFRQGLELLPQPRDRWSAAEWFLAGIGDALWFLGCHLNALPVWRDILLVGGLGNPWVHLRRGQTLYELGDFVESQSELMRALLLGGSEFFEDEPRKYWDYITSLARPPEGRQSWEGWEGVDQDSPLYAWLMDPGKYELCASPSN